MKILVVLLTISVLGNAFGLFILYKFLQKDRLLKATISRLEQKDRLLEQINRGFEKRLVFIHHSVGRNWLSEGGLKDSLIARGIAVRSITRGNPVGQDTDMHHWVPKFRDGLNQIVRFDSPPNTPYSGPEENSIVMFKSCYPNSDIIAPREGEPGSSESARTIEDYQAVMEQLGSIFAEQPGKLFIYVTSPPLVSGQTTPENARRARLFSKWASEEFIASYQERMGSGNFLVFDLFDILADEVTHTLKEEFQRAPDDSHPNARGGRAATKAFMAFLDRHSVGQE